MANRASSSARKVASRAQAATTKPQQPSKKRLPARERRSQIIEAAICEFGRHGFKGATTKVLSKAANISEATIFKYFRTKADLFLAAFKETTGSERRMVAPVAPPCG